MAIYSATSSDYITRASHFDATQDWTYRFSYRIDATTVGARTPLLFDGGAAGTYTVPWINVGINPGTTEISFSVDAGAGEQDGGPLTISLDYWHNCYLIYNSTLHTLEMLVDEVSVGVLTANLAASFLNEVLLADTGAQATQDSMAYVRVWQGILTEDERAAENLALFAVKTNNLIADTPLSSSSNLLDFSGNHYNWTAAGTLATSTGPRLPIFTDEFIMTQIQNVMIEPDDGGATWPSGLWSMAEVVSYLNQRQNRFLKDTHFQFGIADITATSGVGTYDLPDDWINTIRVLWINSDGDVKELPRSDTWEADYGIPTWSYVNATPEIFYDGGKPITLKVMPAPDEDGTLQVHYVPYGALLTGTGELMTLPDEFTPAVKYGALADMFTKVSRAQDQIRAKYCEQRFQLGLSVAKMLVLGYK